MNHLTVDLPIRAGVTVRTTIVIDQPSQANDSWAFGAMIADLQREGWVLEAFGRDKKTGVVLATFVRRWDIAQPRVVGDDRAMSIIGGGTPNIG